MKKNIFGLTASILLAIIGLIFIAHGLGWCEARVEDRAGLFSREETVGLHNRILEIEKNTGFQILILTVPSLEGKDAESYARDVGNAKGVGHKGQDNGIVLLVAPTERKWFFKTGYGAEAALPDSRLGSIGRNIFVPLYRQKKVSLAFWYTLDQIEKDILAYQGKDKPKPTPTTSSTGDDLGMILALIAGLGLFTSIAIWMIVRRHKPANEEPIEDKPENPDALFLAAAAAAIVTPRKKTDEDIPRHTHDDADYSHHSSRHDDDSYSSPSSSHSSDSDFGGGGGFGGGSFGGGGAGGDL